MADTLTFARFPLPPSPNTPPRFPVGPPNNPPAIRPPLLVGQPAPAAAPRCATARIAGAMLSSRLAGRCAPWRIGRGTAARACGVRRSVRAGAAAGAAAGGGLRLAPCHGGSEVPAAARRRGAAAGGAVGSAGHRDGALHTAAARACSRRGTRARPVCSRRCSPANYAVVTGRVRAAACVLPRTRQTGSSFAIFEFRIGIFC